MGDNGLEPLALSEAGRRTLENWAQRRSTAQGLALRARIVLACADGGPNIAVAARLGVNRGTVTRWRARFLARLKGAAQGPNAVAARATATFWLETLQGDPGPFSCSTHRSCCWTSTA